MNGHGGSVRIGTSGWRYAGWRGTFYPARLAQRRELEYLATRLDSVELNGSFYSLQRAASYRRWREETPADFVFAVKGGRYITHMLRLRNTGTALANFFASGPLALGGKLGPILWQLPERERFDAGVLTAFCAALPTTTHQAAALARGHDEKVKDASEPELDRAEREPARPLRHALEVRHPSFVGEAGLRILRDHNVALVVADTAGKWPATTEVTADFVYVRLHGSQELYTSGYTPEELHAWVCRVAAWSAGSLDVYVYFDNDAKTFAPFDAMNLARILHETRLDPN